MLFFFFVPLLFFSLTGWGGFSWRGEDGNMDIDTLYGALEPSMVIQRRGSEGGAAWLVIDRDLYR